MTTEWFKNDGSGVAVHSEDPRMLLIGDSPPDWVMIPADSPERAGDKLRVLGCTERTCPKCKQRQTRVLELEDNYRVAECMPGGCGFVFYKVNG
jgi:hypothetical protein